MCKDLNIKQIVIAFGIDGRFVMPIAVTLASALSKLHPEYGVIVYVIHGGITEDEEHRLRRVVDRTGRIVRLELVKADTSKIDNLITDTHITTAAYYRLLIPEVIPNAVHRVIYLDGDLLVRTDLSILWEVDLEETPVAAVREHSAPFVSSHYGVKRYHELGLDPNARYLNSGLMVLDLDRWRSDGITQLILLYLIGNRQHVQFHDQDGINAILNGLWKELDPRWNVPVYLSVVRLFESFEESDYKNHIRSIRHKLVHEANIWHFTGPRKPWVFGCGLPGQLSWLKILSECGWYKPEELAHFLRIKILQLDFFFRVILRLVRCWIV